MYARISLSEDASQNPQIACADYLYSKEVIFQLEETKKLTEKT